MAVMPNSAQRSVRISRSDLVTKNGAPIHIKAAPLTDIIVKDQAEFIAGTIEKDTIKVDSSSVPPASIFVPPLEAQYSLNIIKEETASTLQPRRSMQRTRKPSSRLLPSPSPPPPSRSAHSYHQSAHVLNKTTAAAATTSNLLASNAPKNMQKKQQAATVTPLVVETVNENDDSQRPVDEREFGPGKRKRRPSTMSKPPSTITKQAPLTIASQSNPLPALSLSTPSSISLKVRLNRVASKSQSPEEKSQLSKGPRKSKVEATEIVSSVGGAEYDSDSNVHKSYPEHDGEARYEEDSDAGSSILPVLRKIGHVRIKVHPLSAAREKFGGRRWPTSTGSTLLEPPPLISRRGGLKAAHQGISHASQRCVKIGGISESNHQRSHSTSVLDGRRAWNPSAIAPTLRFRLSGHVGVGGDEEVSEASDLDDEDDFHVAMLDGGDFGDASHHDKAVSLSPKSSHRDCKSGDDSEGEDTPATTPRSPQSTCDLPERRWSTGADNEEKENSKASKDYVFAHALETSSRRPHTHAGALTLSLPFEEEMMQGSEEDANLRRTVAQIDSIKEEEDNQLTPGLLSPAIQHSILGLSSKQHILMLSSPRTANSAFTSPALGPSVHDIKTEPLSLSLPPPVSLSRARENLKMQMKLEKHSTRSEMSSSALHSDEEVDEDREGYEHAVMIMDPPERMCLSELDRAWEQSEYLTKARRMVSDVEDDELSTTEVDIKVSPAGTVSSKVKELDEELSRSTRGSKRLSMANSREKEEKKKSKTTSPSKSKVMKPSPGRRSARHSGI